MMEMGDKIFNVCDVPSTNLEEHLNECAHEGLVLHSIHQSGGNASLPYFTVVTYGGFNWDDYKWKKEQAELAAEKKAEEKWSLTMGTTTNADLGKKLNQKSGGHANE